MTEFISTDRDKRLYQQAYAQAIEDAAKVSEAQKHFDDAGMIRALLSKGAAK